MEADCLTSHGGERLLHFQLGSVVKVIRFISSEECRAEVDGLEGFVLRSCIRLRPCGWFGGEISILKARSLLLQQLVAGSFAFDDGMFIVHYSKQFTGFALSVKVRNIVRQFLIHRFGGFYFIWDNDQFTSLNKLVEHYKANPIKIYDSTTLKVKLRAGISSDIVIVTVQGAEKSEPRIASVDRRQDAIAVVKASFLQENNVSVPGNLENVVIWNFNDRKHRVLGPIELNLVTADLRRVTGAFYVTTIDNAPDLLITEELLSQTYFK